MPNFDLDLLLKRSPVFLIMQYITSLFSMFFDPHDVASGTSVAEGDNVIIQTDFLSQSIHINITHIITFYNFNKMELDSMPSLHSRFNNPTPPSDSNFLIIPVSQQIRDKCAPSLSLPSPSPS
jgi:hypothetical protein